MRRKFNTCYSLLCVNVRIRDIVVCQVSTISHYFALIVDIGGVTPPRSLQMVAAVELENYHALELLLIQNSSYERIRSIN